MKNNFITSLGLTPDIRANAYAMYVCMLRIVFKCVLCIRVFVVVLVCDRIFILFHFKISLLKHDTSRANSHFD